VLVVVTIFLRHGQTGGRSVRAGREGRGRRP